MSDTWLITGASGQLGKSLAEQAAAEGVHILSPPRAELDLSHAASIRKFFGTNAVSAVINCAAYTAVDKAEAEPELAMAVNAKAPAVMAEECGSRNLPLIHVSTDYVFDGRSVMPYREDDAITPLGVYGRSKAEGETAIQSSGSQFAIVRTAWLLSSHGTNFLNTMLRLANERSEIRIVDDQHGSPTSVGDLAAALLTIAKRLGGQSGIWHFVNRGEATWFDLARHIFEQVAAKHDMTPILIPISTAEYPTPAKRPAWSVLATEQIERDFQIVPRPWQDAVSEIIAERLR